MSSSSDVVPMSRATPAFLLPSGLEPVPGTRSPADADHVEEKKSPASILIVDDEPGLCSFLQRKLGKQFALLEVAHSAEDADALRQRLHFDLIVTDIRLPQQCGVGWVQEMRDQGIGTPVIFMTAFANVDTAIAALRAGAVDFILKPFRTEQMLSAIHRCLEQTKMQRENFVLRRQMDKMYTIDGMVGQCQTMKNVCEVIRRVAPTPSTVLIGGESGTGKELAARAIHQWSGRSGSFVPLNCGAVSTELLESELFGHTKGAFTGAHQAREGLFGYANSGTLFLDEIGEMPLNMQAKLLRVLEEGAVRPVGANREVPVDVRIVAATNRDLQQDVREGRFRKDLFYRLNVLRIDLPPLRERPDDIKRLLEYFNAALSSDLGLSPAPLSAEDLAMLQSYPWPGNVREFKNLIERSLLLGLAPSECLTSMNEPNDNSTALGDQQRLHMTLEEMEKHHILAVLSHVEDNQSEAARRLGISRKTLGRKLHSWLEAKGSTTVP